MTPIAVYDACVLYPSPLRDFLIRVAIEDLVVARWSERILDEVFRNIAKNRPDLSQARLLRTRQAMCAAVLDCLVNGSPEVESALALPDPDDRHVVSSAVRAGAGLIVTFNLRDFPEVELARHGIVPVHPDVFACELLQRHPTTVIDILHGQAADLKRPPLTTPQVLEELEKCGLTRFGAAIRAGGQIG